MVIPTLYNLCVCSLHRAPENRSCSGCPWHICHVYCAIMSSRHSAHCMIAGSRDKDTMQPRRNHNTFNSVTRLLCVIALLFVGFAHRIPAALPQPDVDLTAYALPDGTLPVICHSPAGTNDGSGNAIFFSDCEFCRLASAAILPTPHDVRAPPCASPEIAPRAVHDLATFPIHYAGTPTRGPPLT